MGRIWARQGNRTPSRFSTDALLGDDEGHDAYRDMLRLARCHVPLRALNTAAGVREKLELEIFTAVTGIRAERTESLRFTLRLLRHEAPDDWGPLLNALSEATASELLASPHNAAYRPPAGQWRSLAKSPSIWRLFEALAEARRADSGPLSQEQLQEAIWPGEFLTTESAANRLHVSLSKLRKAGLKGVVVRDERGYFIEPAIALVFV